MSTCDGPHTEDLRFIAGFNIVGVLCCIVVVVFGWFHRSSRVRESAYTPGPYVPIGEDSGRNGELT